MRTLESPVEKTVKSSEAALDDTRAALIEAQKRLRAMKGERDAALQSLLEVAQMRRSPVRLPLCQSDDEEQEEEEGKGEVEGGVVGSRGSCAGSNVVGYGRGDNTRDSISRWSSNPDSSIVHKQEGADSHLGGRLTRVTDDDADAKISVEEINNANRGSSSSFLGTSGETAPSSPGGISRISSVKSVELAAAGGGQRRNEDRRGAYRSTSGCSSGGGTGEHACRVCGAPTPSFRKLFDCRLSLDQARMEVVEAQAQVVEVEEGAAAALRKVKELRTSLRKVRDYRLGVSRMFHTFDPKPPTTQAVVLSRS